MATFFNIFLTSIPSFLFWLLVPTFRYLYFKAGQLKEIHNWTLSPNVAQVHPGCSYGTPSVTPNPLVFICLWHLRLSNIWFSNFLSVSPIVAPKELFASFRPDHEHFDIRPRTHPLSRIILPHTATQLNSSVWLCAAALWKMNVNNCECSHNLL